LTVYSLMLIIATVMVIITLCLDYKLSDTEIIEVRPFSPHPLTLDEKTDKKMSFHTELLFVNEGKQCGTIMDAIVRSQLPYEQYDGIEVRAKAERQGYPREDDYFEAVIIQKKGVKDDRMTMLIKVTLTARKGLNLTEALANMVDLPLDLIYQQTGRTVVHYKKLRLTIKAEEIAKLAGVKLLAQPFIMK